MTDEHSSRSSLFFWMLLSSPACFVASCTVLSNICLFLLAGGYCINFCFSGDCSGYFFSVFNPVTVTTK